MKLNRLLFVIFLFVSGWCNYFASAQQIENFKLCNATDIKGNIVLSEFQFNGYTNYWHDLYREWIHYGNLYKTAIPNLEYTIAQSKVDIAEDLGIPGLSMQEGFFSSLQAAKYLSLDQPTILQLEAALQKDNVLAIVDPNSETGKKFTGSYAIHPVAKEKLKSHQYNAVDFVEVNAFVLENGQRKLFVISSTSQPLRDKLTDLIANTRKVLQDYDLHKGWFGAKTLKKSVTCTPGHYLEVIGKGMNEGNDWFVFDGYMDFLAKQELEDWMEKANLSVVTDVGTPPVYGLNNYDGVQVQGNYTNETWIKLAHDKGGYVFRQVFDTLSAPGLAYDGYFAIDSRDALRYGTPGNDGNKEQIDADDFPFVCATTELNDDAIPSMILFTKKGEPLTRQRMWDAIMARREVAVLDNGIMMGPALYRHALDLLLLDRVFPEEYFGDKVSLEAYTDGYKLRVNLVNAYSNDLTGELEVVLPPELKISGSQLVKVQLPAHGSKTMEIDIQPLVSALNKANPIAVYYKWGTQKKGTVAMLELPRAISVHQLLYGHTPKVSYPVTIHNFTTQSSFPVKIEVTDKNNPKKIAFSSSTTCTAATGSFQDLSFDLKVPAGSYNVKVSTLGVENISQLGVGVAKGLLALLEIDINNDGIKEYRMENDSVQVTLLATGARVIEYIVKSKQDNVLFKLWPEKPVDDRRMFRKRGYYPYGGFEDFLGQGSMETHKQYNVEVIKSKGDYVQVKMTADYFGNKLEKIFTLYGNSPLLEIKFALTFINTEANVIGPQPILELGTKHWTEDVFIVPEKSGLIEFVMDPKRSYGRLLYLTEGWNAGYDTKENISFVGAFPVTEPLFLHMWMNHPANKDAHHYYVEFQPWTPIYQKSTMYFSYYMWGVGGSWENGVKALREKNLISTQ